MYVGISLTLLNDFIILPSSAAEEKVSKLQDALKEVQNTHIKEVGKMNSQLDRQRQRCEELTEAVSYSFQMGLSLRGALQTSVRPYINFEIK